MRKFVVVTEVYERYGGGKLSVGLVEAEDENDLAAKLEPELYDPETPREGYFEVLTEANGDGMNFYVIKELVGDRLKPVLVYEE